MNVLPRIVLCILHDRPEVIDAICADSRAFEFSKEYSDCGRDERVPRAFECSWDLVNPSVTADDTAMVANHRNVAYVLSRWIDGENASAVATEGLAIIEKSFANGARAVKCDSSGIAHGRGRWLELAYQKTPEALYYSYVCRPISSDRLMYSCGMHLLALPDIMVECFTDREAARIIDAFALYLISEDGRFTVAAGQTFACSTNEPILEISHEECRTYEVDDFFFNPFGYWRLKPRRA